MALVKAALEGDPTLQQAAPSSGFLSALELSGDMFTLLFTVRLFSAGLEEAEVV